MSEDDLDQMTDKYIEEGNVNIFTANIFEGARGQQVLNEVKMRHEQIIELEKSIRELFELFQDMALLVREQGVRIDSIEDHVLKTKDIFDQSVKHLKRAMSIQGRYRRKTCFMVTLLIVVLVIVVTAIVISESKESK